MTSDCLLGFFIFFDFNVGENLSRRTLISSSEGICLAAISSFYLLVIALVFTIETLFLFDYNFKDLGL